MEYTVSAGAVCMPAHYALVPQEEMIYLDGGITQQDVIQFGVNVLVNGFMVLSGAFFSAGVGMLANAFVGTTLKSERRPVGRAGHRGRHGRLLWRKHAVLLLHGPGGPADQGLPGGVCPHPGAAGCPAAG